MKYCRISIRELKQVLLYEDFDVNCVTSYFPFRVPIIDAIRETTSKSCIRSLMSWARFSAWPLSCPPDRLAPPTDDMPELRPTTPTLLSVRLDSPRWLGVTLRVRLERFVVVPVPNPELLPAAKTRARVPPAAPSVKNYLFSIFFHKILEEKYFTPIFTTKFTL